MDFEDMEILFSDRFTGPNYSRKIQEVCEFSWIINLEEFLSCQRNPSLKEQYLESPEFPANSDADFKWMMRLYPYEYENPAEMRYSSVYLYMNDTSKIAAEVHAKGDIILRTENDHVRTIIDDNFVRGQGGWGNYQLIETSLLESDLCDGPAEVNVYVSVKYELRNYHTSNFCSERILLDNYLSLLNSNLFSDLTIHTKDGIEFKVHSIILAARSKVFAAMLTNEMKENITRTIAIEDYSSSIMKDLLNFIYGCKVEFRSVDDTLNLLKASDKYELLDLKSQCVEYLSAVATKDNICDLLIVADDHDLSELKKNLLKFIRKNKRKFTESDSYKEILVKKPRLLVDITVSLAGGIENATNVSS